MQNISYLVVVKYLAILAGIYDFLNYSIVLLYSMYYNTSRTLNKSVNEESEIFDAIVTHESSDMYHHPPRHLRKRPILQVLLCT